MICSSLNRLLFISSVSLMGRTLLIPGGNPRAQTSLAPIGARTEQAAADKKLLNRIAEQGRRAREIEIGAITNASLVEALSEDLRGARAEIVRLRRENTSLRERLAMVEDCGFLFGDQP